MSDKLDPTTYEITQRLNDVEQQLKSLTEYVATLSEDVRQISHRLGQIDRPRMSAAEALQTFDILKRTDPSLTLQSFAMQHNLSYDTLRQARSRQQRKKK